MIASTVHCDIANCGRHAPYDPEADSFDALPDGWVFVMEGSTSNEQHFCSRMHAGEHLLKPSMSLVEIPPTVDRSTGSVR